MFTNYLTSASVTAWYLDALYWRRTVDGRYKGMSVDGEQCEVSRGREKVKWRVDLGDVHRIQHIVIQLKTDK